MSASCAAVVGVALFLWPPSQAGAADAAGSRVRLDPAAQRAALALHAPASNPVSGAPVATEEETQAASQARSQAPGQARQRPFRHAAHRSVQCQACHDMTNAHGRITIRAPQDCQNCHHRDATPATCSNCHETARIATNAYAKPQTLRVAGETRARELPFRHAEHESLECSRCHTDPQNMSVAESSCTSCHTDHHQADSNCTACHAQPAETAHTAAAHLTCSGSGCHTADFVTAAAQPRTREVCLACHRAQTDHRPGERCAECHVLPPFHGRAGGTP